MVTKQKINEKSQVVSDKNIHYKMICKNCNNKFEGKFCNCCGQSSSIGRINWKYLSKSIADGVFQINHGFLYTAKVLLLKPGKSLQDFFLGKRKKFYQPFAFLILSVTIFLLTKLIGNETLLDFIVNGLREREEPNKLWYWGTFKFLATNQIYMFLYIVPLFSIASIISFKKEKYNFSEYVILNLYITGEQVLIYSIFSFVKDRDSLLLFLPLILGFCYNIYVYNKFLNQLSWLNRNLRLLLTYFIYLALMFLSLTLFLIITLYIDRYFIKI